MGKMIAIFLLGSICVLSTDDFDFDAIQEKEAAKLAAKQPATVQQSPEEFWKNLRVGGLYQHKSDPNDVVTLVSKCNKPTPSILIQPHDGSRPLRMVVKDFRSGF